MKAAIMQPTYLPWMGYFALIEEVDVFVFLDDVQFSKQSWQQRNRIKINDDIKILSVPISKKESTSKLIKDTLFVGGGDWQGYQKQVLTEAYKSAPFFNEVMELFSLCVDAEVKQSLSVLNQNLIQSITVYLGFKEPKIINSSDIKKQEGKAERLIDILNAVDCAEYLSPVGSFNYINENNIFAANGIDLSYQNYSHPVYKQLGSEFIGSLAILDLMFNEGVVAGEILRTGINKSYSHNELSKVLDGNIR